MRTLQIGFSPCPNDTFIFDALVNEKIDTGDLRFEPCMAGVDELNELALHGELPVTKLSYHAFAYVSDDYALLEAGSALGHNCGPLLVSKQKYDWEDVNELSIAIPGRYTTANFLLNLAFPEAQQKTVMKFSQIEDAVLNETVDAGLLIHENRFTYQQKGLQKITDLGEFWERTTGYPIPLGGIAVRRDLDRALQQQVNQLMKKSVQWAMDHPEETKSYVRQYAQEMAEDVLYKHINLYVNEYTRDLGDKGRGAIQTLFEKAQSLDVIPPISQPLFVNSSESVQNR